MVKSIFKQMGYEIRTKPFLMMSTESMGLLRYFGRLFDEIAHVEGDIVECGVYHGRTFLMLAYLLSEEQSKFNRMIWGFDSFKGFPQPTAEDILFRIPNKGRFRATSLEKVSEFFRSSGLSREFIDTQIRLIPGFFSESLKNFPDRPIAFLHIDCDLYQAHHEVLTNLFPKVAEGGIVSFDDYHDVDWPGATKAIDEFFASTGYPIRYDPLPQKYFVIKKR